jgi:hypothetical protein
LHVKLLGHPPQFTVPPQPSEKLPQEPAGKSLHCIGVQQAAVWRSQVDPVAQEPQLIVPPQLLGNVPQVAPRSPQVAGWQPHWFGVPPPPHESGRVHPQTSVPPHPLSMLPHCPAAHEFGVQHWSVMLLQTWMPVQKLQLSVPPQPSVSAPPHVMPAYDWHVFGVHCGPQIPFVLQMSEPEQAPQ